MPASSSSGFPRPPIVRIEQVNPRNWRAPKGHGEERTLKELRRLWDSLVAQVLQADLVLGTYANLPERRLR